MKDTGPFCCERFGSYIVYLTSIMALRGGRSHSIWRLQILVHMGAPRISLMALFWITSKAAVCLSDKFTRVRDEYSIMDLMAAL